MLLISKSHLRKNKHTRIRDQASFPHPLLRALMDGSLKIPSSLREGFCLCEEQMSENDVSFILELV